MESSLFSSKPWGGGRGGCDLRSSPGRGGSLPLSWQTFSGEGQDPNVRGPWPPGGWEVRFLSWMLEAANIRGPAPCACHLALLTSDQKVSCSEDVPLWNFPFPLPFPTS